MFPTGGGYPPQQYSSAAGLRQQQQPFHSVPMPTNYPPHPSGSQYPQYSSTYEPAPAPHASSSSYSTSAFQQQHHQQLEQQQDGQQQPQRRNGRDTLLSMRKHRSLDGAQFFSQLGPFGSTSTAYNPPDATTFSSPEYGDAAAGRQPMMFPSAHQQFGGPASAPAVRQPQPGGAGNYESQLLLTRAPTSVPYQQPISSFPYQQTSMSAFNPNVSGFGATNNPIQAPYIDTTYGATGNNPMRMRAQEEDDPLASTWLYYQPISAQSILQQTEFDPRALRQEFTALCDRYNYLAASVRTFWAPELQRERQKRREQAYRADQLEQRLSQMNSDTQMLRVELDRRREEEDSGIGRPLSHPRDFTDHSITLHEWQTLKSKLERSELSLSERNREFQNIELRAKCAEEQKEEAERRNEILARSNAANEAQLKLLHEDLNVLRGKLELKNQQLDTREKANKKLEMEMEALRLELKESQQNVQDGERRASQLTHKLDQMERQVNEQNLQMEKLRQRLLQQPSTKTEVELQQKLENALEYRRKLEQLIDQLRQQNDTERQQQLQQFLDERDQLQANIAYLKKELADRHVLISSQSEKISQLDSVVKNAQQKSAPDSLDEVRQQTTTDGSLTTEKNGCSSTREETDLERTHRELDRLLKRVLQLEREKTELLAAAKREGGGIGAFLLSEAAIEGTAEMSADERVNALRQRIRDLEEALRESVECTSEKEKALAEQKRLVEKLSSQVTELFESGGTSSAITAQQRQTRDALAQLAEAQKQLEAERQQRHRQVSAVRKELGMALVAEKEAAVSLVQSCCPIIEAVPGLREKLDTLQKQKEALKHTLLMSSTSLDDQQQQHFHQRHQFGMTTAALGNGFARNTAMGGIDASVLRSPAMVQPGRPMSAAATLLPYGTHSQQMHADNATLLSQPIRIQTAALHVQTHPHNGGGLGISAPASLNFYTPTGIDDYGQQVDEEGIWA